MTALRASLLCACALATTSCLVYDDSLLIDGGENPATGGGTASGGAAGETGGTGGLGTGGSTGGNTNGGGSPGGGGETGGSGGSTGGSGGDTGGTGGSGLGRCDLSGYSTIDMIEDMPPSPNNNTINVKNGRGGVWVTYHGSNIDVTPVPDGNDHWPDEPMTEVPGSDPVDFAAHYTSTSTGATENWHQFGFFLTSAFGGWDATGYDGIVFCAKDSDAVGRIISSVRLTDDTLPVGSANTWDSNSIELAADWTVYEVPFPDSGEWNYLDDLKIVEFHLVSGQDYDIWIDTIAFYNE